MDIKFLQNEHYNYKNQLKSMVDLSDKNEVINLIARNNNPYNLQPTSMMYPLRSQGIKKKKIGQANAWSLIPREQKNHIIYH